MARQADVVIVVGGAHSNNTRELAATCARHCGRVHQVETAAGLREEWFVEAECVGITAGTSTPDWIVDAVERMAASDFQGQPGFYGAAMISLYFFSF